MQGIFVSYRREDSAGHTGRLFDHLSEHFGKDRVFMDISDIEPGVDFVDSIEKALTDCAVILVIIGRSWSACVDAAGQRRLDNPNDFIRLETATSLRRNIRVIPVLVQGARMPTASNLPEELRAITRRQAIEISDTRWDYDTQKLIETLDKINPSAATTAETEAEPSSPSPSAQPALKRKKLKWPRWALLATLLVAGTVATVMVIRQSQEPTTAKPSVTSDSPVRSLRVPNLVGQAVGTAKRQVEKAGFKLGSVRAKRTDTREAGTILSQDPRAGVSLQPGASISMVFAEAPEVRDVKLPDLVGQDFKEALAWLEKLGLERKIERKPVFSNSENGVVLSQKPSAGTRVTAGSRAQLTVGVLVKTHAGGSLELKQTWSVDLDSGQMGTRGGEDLWFHALTATERYLEPRNGALVAFFSDKPPSSPPEVCARTRLGSKRIPISRIDRRSSMCVQTSEGRYAFVQFIDAVGSRGSLLKMKFNTWEKY